ncbi:uncharacterized protein (TIGR02246 family) [Stackebrandtia albiflava]|uniref:Uncharacterized protein (TIGR02246 family) n=1 Tax=Stackebrandtia albiflava TaxID=406432 RepID=A0A562VB40_9ACTN|nr:SgcJ/EcaC family oxidoreductase [Stackebrandtia albiflava]TWJ15084.1 uncharacterized protein (TIGR02246 family) [Stackebrandtia albiflava]
MHDETERVKAVTEVVAAVERSQRNESPEEFIRLFREDAVWTTAHGRRLYGRDAIAEFTRRVLPGAMGDTTVSYRVEDVRFIRPDVAAVKVIAQYYDAEGAELGAPNSPLYVMSEEDGR